MIRTYLTIFILFIPTSMQADDVAWFVGGGSDPGSSQAQVEKNVIWAADVVEQAPPQNGQRRLSIFFADGDLDITKGIKVTRLVEGPQSILNPLAMIYQAEYENVEYLNYKIGRVRGSTTRSKLESALVDDFKKLKQGDTGLFVFNGHGSYDKKDTANNKMLLWQNSKLSVREFSDLLSNVDNSVPMRFVFNQCYSGAFERLVHPNAADTIELVKAPRCGFFAESDNRQAEGCSTSIDSNEYRDYSTYFFAALQGKTRQGEALPVDPDRNKNGEVSLYEAHLYTLAQAHSADLPRSTSEVFLERWQPWYLRWFFAGEGKGNVYAKLANDLARQLRAPVEPSVQRSVLSKQRRRLDRRDKKLKQEAKQIYKAMKELRYSIRYELEQRWPELAGIRYEEYQLSSHAQGDEVKRYITEHEKWPNLVNGYRRYLQIDEQRLEVLRDLTRLDKLNRLNKLARLRQQFEQHATNQQKADYQQLLNCEKLPL